MFNNRHMQVKFVRDNTANPIAESDTVNPEQIAQIATEFTMKTIAAVGVVVAANRVLKTICEVAVVTAQAKIK